MSFTSLVLLMCLLKIFAVLSAPIEADDTKPQNMIGQWYKKTEPLSNLPRHITNVKYNCNKGEYYSDSLKKCSTSIKPL